MTTEQKEKVNQAIDALAVDPDIQKFVKEIEGGVKTTKGNYGRYMQFLTPYAQKRVMLFIVSQSLIKAGADSYGVNWAVKILTGEAF